MAAAMGVYTSVLHLTFLIRVHSCRLSIFTQSIFCSGSIIERLPGYVWMCLLGAADDLRVVFSKKASRVV